MTLHSAKPWIVCLTAALFFFYEFVQMSMFNAISVNLLAELQLSATALGHLSAAYFYANILFMIPAGLILDRFSTKKTILVAMAICVAGTVWFSFSHSLYSAMACRFLTGIGGSFPFLACLRLALRWFPPKRMAVISGLMVTMAMLGGVVAQTPLTLATELIGWRYAVFFDGLFGVILMICTTILVQDSPCGSPIQLTRSTQRLTGTLRAIFNNKENWLYGAFICLLNLPIFLLAQTWGGLYFTQAHHLTPTQASYLTSMVFFGTIIGSPLLGWLSDHSGRRKPLMYLGCLLSLLFILIVMMSSSLSFSVLLALLFGLGFASSAQIIGYPAISESNETNTAAGALGLASVLIMSGGAFFEPLFGRLMEWHWDHTMIKGTPIYSTTDYLMGLSILPIAFLIALLTVFLARETYCRREK